MNFKCIEHALYVQMASPYKRPPRFLAVNFKRPWAINREITVIMLNSTSLLQQAVDTHCVLFPWSQKETVAAYNWAIHICIAGFSLPARAVLFQMQSHIPVLCVGFIIDWTLFQLGVKSEH